jgi:hypothetical protein
MMGSECTDAPEQKPSTPSIVEDGLTILAIQLIYRQASLWGFKGTANRHKEELDKLQFENIKAKASVPRPAECAP